MPQAREPIWLTRSIVEALHREQIFAHGAQAGLREARLLESALARVQQRFQYDPRCRIAELASDYGFGLARNHAFIDGNKRIAFVAMNVFLLLNGFEIDAPEPEVVDIMLQVAAGHLGKHGLAEWIESRSVHYDLDED